MKKVFFAFAAVTVMALVSCNNANQTEATTETVDTTVAPEVVAEPAIDTAAAVAVDSAAAAPAESK